MCISRVNRPYFPSISTSLYLKYHISIKKKAPSLKLSTEIPHRPDTLSVKGKPTLESQYVPVDVSLSEEEESLLISISSFACIKNKNTALKGLQ